MRRTGSIFILLLVCALLFVPHSFAEETSQDDTGQYYSDTLEEIRRLGEDAGLSGLDGESVQKLSVGTILSYIGNSLMSALKSPIRLLFFLLAALIGIRLLSSFTGDGNLSNIYSTVAVVVVAVLILQPVMSLIERMILLTEQVANFVYGFVPVFTGVVISSGQVASGTAYSAIIIGAAQLFSILISSTLMPFICAYLSFGIVGVLQPTMNLSSLQSTIKNGVSFMLALLTTIFVGLFSLQNIVGHAADAQALRAAKLVFSSAIPIVGSAISDAVGSIAGCLQVLKATAGTVGIGGLILIFAPTLIEAGALKLTLTLATIASDVTGSTAASKVLKTLSSALTMLIAVLIAYMLILVVSTAILMSVGS